MTIRRAAFGIMLALALPAAGARAVTFDDPATALRDYVAAPDPAYEYHRMDSSSAGDGYTVHLLRMTSQRWRAPDEATPTLWRHWLVVIVPDKLRRDVAALVVSGGSGRERPAFDGSQIEVAAQLAVLSKSVVAVLMQVPYQPIAFPDAAASLEEDALVAYSWDKAIATGDWSWAAYLPMTKAAVRAMDTVQDFVAGIAGKAIERFVVIGGSKRGAVTWLSAAVDTRVAAIAPLVIDILNLPAQLGHDLAVYGDYPPALHDYVDYGLVQRIGTPEGAALLQVVDPYSYRAALALPKYIVGASGDQFFPPDAAQFYFDDLPGEKLLRYVPNADHSLSNSEATLIDAASGLFAWYLAIVDGKPRPTISWQQTDEGVIVRSSPRPLAARVWKAGNPDARDFRLETIGEAWHVSRLHAVERGVYEVRIVPPATGWKAYFVELAYPAPRPGLCQVYSTRVFVTPDTLPFEGGAAGATVAAGGTLTAAAGPSPASLLGGLFEDVAEEVHEGVLDQIDDDLGERALRYCFARHVDDIDDVVDLYARLGFGQSADHVLEQRLEDLWHDLRHKGAGFVDDAADGVRDVADKVDDALDDLF